MKTKAACRKLTRPPRLEILEERLTPTITIDLDYRFDTSGFFNDPARQAVLQLAADTLGSRLNDSLSAIVPSGSNTWDAQFNAPDSGAATSLPNLTVPANTIVIFVGARVLPSGGELGEGGPGGLSANGSQDWLDTVAARGQAGALGANSTQTDFGPWGGSIVFDSTANWYFGQDATGLGFNQDDFLSVAEHEISHTLGFGTAPSWSNLVSGSQFTGAASRAQFGGNVPTDASGASAAHWANGTRDLGTAGFPRACMDPILPTGTRAAFTPLDFAGLQDLGWQVQGNSGQVQGTLFADINGNGARDTGEPGLGNRVVFADLNGNGIVDAGEPSTTTAANGAFSINLQPSATAYNLRLQTQTGESLSQPNGGHYLLTITPGSTFSNQNFGVTSATAGQVTGLVFQDANANGVFDTGENTLAGRTVFADLNGNGVFDPGEPSTATTANGSYSLTLQQQSAAYQIRFAGGGGDLVSLPVSAGYQATVTAGAIIGGKNFGVVLTSVAVPLQLPPATPFSPQASAIANYVEALYRSILNRNGSPAEYSSWVNLLVANPSARPVVVQAFWNSAEHRTLEVNTYYAEILQRTADPSGLAFWTGQLEQGISEESITKQFLESAEFLNRGDQFFIDFLYQSVLGRTFDTSGEAFWLSSLANHQLTHDQVVEDFLFSTESLTRLVTGYYSIYLNRESVDASGLQFWIGQLNSGLPFASIGEQFLAADEFFASGGR